MKYDRDLIEAIYIIGQSDESLAEKMWNRLTEKEEVPNHNEQEDNGIQLTPNMIVSQELLNYIKATSNANNKVEAIRNLRQKTGLGLKEAKDIVDLLIARGLLK